MMTMKERLEVHRKIERENELNVIRWKVRNLYLAFCRSGQFYEGREILKLLRHGSVTLGLHDEDWNVQTALEGVGLYIWFSRDGYQARAYLKAAKSA